MIRFLIGISVILLASCQNKVKENNVQVSSKSKGETILHCIDTALGRTSIKVDIVKDSIINISAQRNKNACNYSFVSPAFAENASGKYRHIIIHGSGPDKLSDCYLIDDSMLVISLLDFKYRIRPFFFLLRFADNTVSPICQEGLDDCKNYIDGEMSFVLFDTPSRMLYSHTGKNVLAGGDSSYRTIQKYKVSKNKISMVGSKDIYEGNIPDSIYNLSSDSNYLRFYTQNLF